MHTRKARTLMLLGASAVAGWSTDVHNQIGFMAEQFFHPYTVSIVEQLLEPQYNGSLGRAASWADGYAHTHEGHFSYQWHWIDTHDDPPSSCSLNYDHDCSEGGCVISAIVNQTEVLQDCIEDVQTGALSAGTNLTCSYALKWIAHFFGDIVQPLHTSGRGTGGNQVHAIFNNITTQLHAVWDHFIIYDDAKVHHFPVHKIHPFFESLVSRIQQDKFYEAPYMWLACSDPSTPALCATIWARESNSWNCDYVYKHFDNTTDLATSGYAAGAYPIVELQVSKAALRLATWLNKLTAGASRKQEEDVFQPEL